MLFRHISHRLLLRVRIVKLYFEAVVHHLLDFGPLLMEIRAELLRDVSLLLLLSYLLNPHLALEGLFTGSSILVFTLCHLEFKLFEQVLDRFRGLFNHVCF